jgi:hypothetical protein
MRDRCVFPDPQKQHAQCPFRAFTAQKPFANAPHVSHRAGCFFTDVDASTPSSSATRRV